MKVESRAVTVIPATINPRTHLPTKPLPKRRVAGYARVSTDSDEQFTSYAAQVDYYTAFIKENPAWEFVKVYTDEGISGLNTKKRDGFNEMIADALAGRIDLIVTKSVSRFARNTVDSLVTVRTLKEKGVEVFFQKENIFTMDSKGELLITIMSSLAQEESRSISENVTWGHRKRFADGKVMLPYKRFLGYERGEDGLPKVVPEEAKLVRRIYSLFMEGKTPGAIAKILTNDGVPTPSGKQVWRQNTIISILSNEKYKGAAILQKCFTVDFLTKKQKRNEGEVPQYYVEHSHEAIIDPAEWQAVQDEIVRRKNMEGQYSGVSPLATRVICADCGRPYGPKVWHSNSKYRQVVWQCNAKYGGEKKCVTPHLTEEAIQTRFLDAYNGLLDDREVILDDCRTIQSALTDCTSLEQEKNELLREMEIITELTRKSIEENSSAAQDQNEYIARYEGYVARYDALKAKVDQIDSEIAARTSKANAIGGFMFELAESDEPLFQFDAHLWVATIEKAVVQRDGTITFVFKSGTVITR